MKLITRHPMRVKAITMMKLITLQTLIQLRELITFI
uniref:Uncharacterized protein n=1 Tax=Human betaherpesvirus 6 TaxID=10368 RepID=A0A5P9S6J9_9BETA|nr:hypothetical protein [Human betaherpesvirus 6]QFV49773.1 hypothetical protein [Human betaherpesvirus 6]QFX43664.1 hypothetical protein [Human betaherpesvirus 6]